MPDGQLSERSRRIAERKERLRAAIPAVERVRVVPANDLIRKHIAHHPTGIKFPESGSVEWPLDNFTKRRIADGDITIEQASRQRARPRDAE